MCSSEQIWRFVSRKLQDSELYKASSAGNLNDEFDLLFVSPYPYQSIRLKIKDHMPILKNTHLFDHSAFDVGQFLEYVEVLAEVLWEFLLLFRIQTASNACSLMVVQNQAIDSLLSSRASFSGLAEATRRRRCALQAVGILLQMPHTYQARSNQKEHVFFSGYVLGL